MEFKASINPIDYVSALDAIVFFGILLITILAVVYGHRRKNRFESAEASFIDYLIMGRSLTTPMFVATLVATWYGGIFGVTELAFEEGIYNFTTQGVFWYGAYLIFAFFLVDRIAAYRSVTLPDLVGKMFGPRSEKVAAVFNVLNVVPVSYCLSLGIFISLFTGWSLPLCIVVGTLGVSIYASYGGFRAVVYSDLIQFFVMCLAVFLVILFSWAQFGGIDYLQATLPSHYFDPLGKAPLSTTLVWGFIAMSTLVDPNFYQRCFAAQSNAVAKRGILISTVIWCLFDLCTTFGALYAAGAIPEAKSNEAYLVYSLQVLPSGLRGLFIAGLLATILSTIDSYLHIASSTIAHDILPKKFEQYRQRFAYLGVYTTALLSILLAMSFDGSIKAIWKTLGSYSAGCLLLPVMIGYIKPKLINDWSFCLGTLMGAIAISVWRNVERSGFWQNVDDLYVGMTFTLIGLAGGWIVTQFRVPSGGS